MDILTICLYVLIVIILSYLITITDSSNEIFDRKFNQLKKRGLHRAFIQRLWYAVFLVIVMAALTSALQKFYYSEMQKEIDDVKTKLENLNQSYNGSTTKPYLKRTRVK